jgi:hypothetical protein
MFPSNKFSILWEKAKAKRKSSSCSSVFELPEQTKEKRKEKKRKP